MLDGHFKIHLKKRYNPLQDAKYNGCVSRLKEKQVAFDELHLMLFVERVKTMYGEDNELVNAFLHSISIQEQGNGRYLLNHYLSYDRMADLEKVGISKYSRKFTTVISFTDALNWILINLIGSNSKKIFEIDQKTSRAYLSQNDYLADNITMESILGLSQELDLMLNYILKNLDCNKYIDYNKNTYTLSSNLTKEEKFSEILNTYIISYAKRVSRKIISSFYTDLRTQYGRSVLLNSEGIADIIIYSENKIETTIDIVDDNSNFVLEIPVKSYRSHEFLEDIDKINCKVRLKQEDDLLVDEQQII